MQDYQNKLATHIINKGYTIYGGYVYKTLVNNDPTSDIDVHVKNKEDMNVLLKDLEENFGCVKEDEYWDGKCLDMPPFLVGYTLTCPFSNTSCNVDLVYDYHAEQDNDIFKLEYKQVNNKPEIIYKNGTHEHAQKIIHQLRKRQFTSWNDMRKQDKEYFNLNTWTDTNSLIFKINKSIKRVEQEVYQ